MDKWTPRIIDSTLFIQPIQILFLLFGFGSSCFLRVLDISNRKQDNPTITDQALKKVIKFTGICLSIQCTLGTTVTGNICYMSKRLVPVLTPLLAEVNSKNNLKASILLPFQHMKCMHTVTCPDNVFFKMLKTIFQKVNFRDKKAQKGYYPKTVS